MTDTTLPNELLKTDVLGRVRTPAERREMLLDEFERGGLSGQKFAAHIGVKYQTFASWVQKRRKARGVYPEANGSPGRSALEVAQPVQWLEAVAKPSEMKAQMLVVEMPGGAILKIADTGQAVLAARLIRELAVVDQPC